VIAIAAPMAADPPVVALPFAVEDASAVSDDESVSRPPLETVTPAATEAVEVAFVIVRATAAATEIGPLEVEALGVLVAPEPLPPFVLACASAALRSPAT
jgi:hypothetical protein